jgi:tripartite-type tricarboxylate transporter receptor subunit TctC
MPSKLCFSRAIVAALLGLAAFMAVPADAQQWPAKPITIVNGFPAGAGNDIVLRMYQEALEKELGVALVFEYKPGAGGNVASEYVSKQAGDGYTLLIGTAGTHGINAALYKKLPFDVEADFTPIAPIADVPNVLAVNPTVIDAKTVAE